MKLLTKFIKWLCNLLSDYRTDCDMPFGHEDVIVGELLATQGKLYKTEQSVLQVRKLIERYETFATELDPRFAPAAVFSGVARELSKALDGEQ